MSRKGVFVQVRAALTGVWWDVFDNKLGDDRSAQHRVAPLSAA